MGISALYKHPWFITMWSSRTFKLDFVVGYEDISVDAWLYSDHQRYFFFQQFSTVRTHRPSVDPPSHIGGSRLLTPLHGAMRISGGCATSACSPRTWAILRG
eukprot:scaffold283676_cov27-Tisochrysis_lutea.AAC.2